MTVLADSTPVADVSTWMDFARSGGPICIFILLIVAAAVIITRFVIVPLNQQKNEAEAARRKSEEEKAEKDRLVASEQSKNAIMVAEKFAIASGRMDTATARIETCVSRLDDMHERCHARSSA